VKIDLTFILSAAWCLLQNSSLSSPSPWTENTRLSVQIPFLFIMQIALCVCMCVFSHLSFVFKLFLPAPHAALSRRDKDFISREMDVCVKDFFLLLASLAASQIEKCCEIKI
jgi:hypothetical protein